MINVLLQTTIGPSAENWCIERFGLLQDFLSNVREIDGKPLFSVTARDRSVAGRPDPILSTLHESSFDELWLFAVDTGDGLTSEDCQGIGLFRKRGGGLMVTRDHMDLGSSLCTVGGVGAAHHFHSKNQDPDESRRRIDDPHTSQILWPNYHSGANGGYQRVRVVGAPHPVLRDPAASDGCCASCRRIRTKVR